MPYQVVHFLWLFSYLNADIHLCIKTTEHLFSKVKCLYLLYILLLMSQKGTLKRIEQHKNILHPIINFSRVSNHATWVLYLSFKEGE